MVDFSDSQKLLSLSIYFLVVDMSIQTSDSSEGTSIISLKQ
jgi:hypothetical protein